VFDIRRFKWQRYRRKKHYDKRFKDLKKKKATGGEIAQLNHSEQQDMQEFDDTINYFAGQKLLDQARSLDVEIPPYTDQTMWVQHDNQDTIRWFTPKARAQVRKAIDEVKSRRFEVKTLWVTKIILPLAGVTVGILGALIGLVAALKK
jgi:hypothetical protein